MFVITGIENYNYNYAPQGATVAEIIRNSHTINLLDDCNVSWVRYNRTDNGPEWAGPLPCMAGFNVAHEIEGNINGRYFCIPINSKYIPYILNIWHLYSGA